MTLKPVFDVVTTVEMLNSIETVELLTEISSTISDEITGNNNSTKFKENQAKSPEFMKTNTKSSTINHNQHRIKQIIAKSKNQCQTYHYALAIMIVVRVIIPAY